MQNNSIHTSQCFTNVFTWLRLTDSHSFIIREKKIVPQPHKHRSCCWHHPSNGSRNFSNEWHFPHPVLEIIKCHQAINHISVLTVNCEAFHESTTELKLGITAQYVSSQALSTQLYFFYDFNFYSLHVCKQFYSQLNKNYH